ncbi:MAG: VWA domain-containing protein [Deltaproteobacteria bacterium]|nr:VWA domain-containing protein [Deltaproteobacteria bacterium]
MKVNTLGLSALALGLTVSGCAGLKLTLLNASARRPSNIAMYFTVDRNNGQPVGGLTSERFTVYEDDRPVSALESRQTILNPQVTAVHYTLLLMDMSGSVTESGQVPVLQEAARAFVERVERQQRVAVYAFDGSATITPIVPFTDSAGSAARGVNALASFRPRDPSTNLHGAVVAGIQQLTRSLAAAPQPLKFGTLVVFTDGTDRAARVTREQMMESVRASEHSVFSIGVGAEVDPGELRQIGRTGTVLQTDPAAVRAAFDQIAQQIEQFTQRYYLFSYCSPARAGAHRVRIEANTPDGARGGLEYQFDATGFAPNCDPNTPPNFDTTRGEAGPGATTATPSN